MNLKNIFLRYLPITTALFILASYFGYLVASVYPELVQETLDQLMDKFSPLKDQSAVVIFLYIFINNSLIDLAAILSFFIFGLGALFLVFSNGFTIGLVLNSFVQEEGALKIAAALVPHGLFEIPSFLFAAAIGLWLGIRFLFKLIDKEPFKPHFIMAMKLFFKVILLLNLIAALIETFLTPIIYSQF